MNSNDARPTPSLWKRSSRALRLFFSLSSGSDVQATVTRIRSGVRLRGANLWILVCAAILASIGLNTSSVAVIIGAMLISPLMGPILGIGLGIAIHDRAMLFRAFRTFGTAVALSIAASVLYFWITPITTITSELLARTSPTLLDVCVAFFGGIAGIVAGSRRETTTAIPGVAIATALMPPLCTAGYGLANGNWPVFWGAFYLFFLNAVFISLATFLIVRLLRIPFVTYVDRRAERRVRRWIIAIVLAALAPSVVIFYDVIQELRSNTIAEQFVREQLEQRGRKALSWNLETTDTAAMLRVYLAGPPLTAVQVDSLSKRLPAFGLKNGRLRVVQLTLPVQTTTHVEQQDLLKLLQDPQLREELAQSVLASSAPVSAAPPLDTMPITSIRQEMRATFPTFLEVEHSEQHYQRHDTTDTVHLFLLRQQPTAPRSVRRRELVQMQSYLRARLPSDSVAVLEVTAVPDSLTGTLPR